MTCGINLASGKGFGPRDRVFLVVPPVAAAAAAPNSLIRTAFEDIPRMDRIGRVGHLVGLFIRGTVQYDAVAATMPTEMPGALLLTAIDNIELRAGGHSFFQGADGLDLDEDLINRENKRIIGLPAAVADGNATDAQVVVSWLYYFDRPLRADGPARPGDGSIPLFLFDKDCDAQAGLRFRVATAPSSGGGQVATFPGVTFDGFAANDLSVYAIVRYDDDVFDDAAWSYRTVPTSELNGSFSWGDMAEYIAVRDRVNTAGWLGVSAQPTFGTVAGYTGARSYAGDEEILDGRTALEAAIMNNGIYGMGDDGPQAGNGPMILTVATPEQFGLIVTPPSRRRLDMFRGRVRWSFTARTGATASRVIGRGWSANPNGYRDKIMAHSPIPVVKRETAAQNPSPKAAQASAIIPNKLVLAKR